MIERGSFARRLGSGGPTVFGTWVKLPTLETVELLGHAGFDFIVVDMEHAPLTLESAYRAIVMAQAMGMGALVRCRIDPTAISNACSTRAPTESWCRV